MSVLQDAVFAAEERKMAAGLGDNEDPRLVFTDGEMTDRAIFSGFDIDFDELCGQILAAAAFFMRNSATNGLIPLFSASWADGFLIGLMVKSVAPHHEPPGPGNLRDSGSGGE